MEEHTAIEGSLVITVNLDLETFIIGSRLFEGWISNGPDFALAVTINTTI